MVHRICLLIFQCFSNLITYLHKFSFYFALNWNLWIAFDFSDGSISEIVDVIYEQSVKRKKRNTPSNSITKYCKETKLVPINMNHCLLQFGALKFALVVRLHGGSLPNFNFFNVNSQIWQSNRKVCRSNGLDTNFHSISDISLRVIRRRNYN